MEITANIYLPNIALSGTIIYIYFAGMAGNLLLIPNNPDIFINLKLNDIISVSPTGCAVLITSENNIGRGYYSLNNLGTSITYTSN